MLGSMKLGSSSCKFIVSKTRQWAARRCTSSDSAVKILLATFAYPSPAQFLQYSGWERGRTTFRDKAAFQTTPCSSNVLTMPPSEQKGNCVQQVLLCLAKRMAPGMRTAYLL